MDEFANKILEGISTEDKSYLEQMITITKHELDAQNSTFFAGGSVIVFLLIVGIAFAPSEFRYFAYFSFVLAIINIVFAARYYFSRKELRTLLSSLQKSLKNIS